MSALPSLGVTCNASLLTDRETGKTYAIHTGACGRAFSAMLTDAGISELERFAPMGPTRLDDGEACDWGKCEVPA